MDQYVNDLQVVINVLQTVEMKATYSNMNSMMASIQKLMKIRDELSLYKTSKSQDNMEGEAR